ncbi:Pre-rRNA-processing protein esf2 [Papilio machaon]|uniref:Activator of basal transcription 1 n=1 Tax=Papilio machaon TaxID=76193 RepID=A0A0N1I6G7_PAPMA|nr:Pre-rRNA-processing protein esf2 [Papilio machaon]
MPEADTARVPENGSECDSSAENDGKNTETNILQKKKKKRGIIYLSTIPPYMNVAKIREIFSQYGEVGRIYLQPSTKPETSVEDWLVQTLKYHYHTEKLRDWKQFRISPDKCPHQKTNFEPGEKRKRVPNQFTEGWVEFQKKKVAKQVAANLNNAKIGTRKKSRYYDMIWNIKYIPRFKWVHLSERLAYEKAAMKQRLRAEISQAKKEAHFLQNNVEKSKKIKRKKAMETAD